MVLLHSGFVPPPPLPLTSYYSYSQKFKCTTKAATHFTCQDQHAKRIQTNSGGGRREGYQFASATKLAIFYSKTSTSLNEARKVFDQIPHRTLPPYAALITSYSRSQRWWDILSLLSLMIHQGHLPDKFLLPTILKACSSLHLLTVGRMFHGYVVRNNLDLDVFVGNALIHMYSNCGDLPSSTTVFHMMPQTDVVSWTALVSAYMDVGLSDDAVRVFESMKFNGVKPDLISWNALVSGFARNGDVAHTLHFLQVMQESGVKPGVSTWNGIISGCVQNQYFEDALDVFSEMLRSFVKPNAVTSASILPSCGALQDLNLGKAIHADVLKRDIIPDNVFVAGSLVDMYSKCGRRDMAERAFVEIDNKNTAVWNQMITAYVNEGNMIAALKLFHQMQVNGLKPDAVTYNTMVSGYARTGQKGEAFAMFSQMSQMGLTPTIVSLNVLISGFQQSGYSSQALSLFRIMQLPSNIIGSNSSDGSSSCGCKHDLYGALNVSIQPNSVTSTSALATCADLNSLHHGREIHGYVLRNRYDSNIYVSSALIDMYAKCNDMNSASKVFYNINDKSTVSWNILMAGHINNGEPEEGLKLFLKMLEVGLKPSSTTLKIILSICCTIAGHRLVKELHGYIVKCGFHEFLLCSLMDMYAKSQGGDWGYTGTGG